MNEWHPGLTRKSRFLSLVLRHDPSAAGIELDANGWADVDALLAGSRGRLTRDELDLVVDTNPKQRFAIDASGTRIRAVQGHSVDVDLAYEPAVPPAVLFHGTHPGVLDTILAEGLKPMARRHVHLSTDEETASTVGARRGRPVILRVDAGAMHADGHEFWQATNGVWLCDAVPSGFLTG